MEDLLEALDEAVEKKYQKIKETGKIYSGIMEFYEQARWMNSQIAEYVRKKMIDLAIKRATCNKQAAKKSRKKFSLIQYEPRILNYRQRLKGDEKS